MKLEKALEILEKHYILHFDVPLADLNEASKLGIEALKREKERQELDIDTRFGLLPGQTDN